RSRTAMEPLTAAAPGELGLIVVPALAIDALGQRIGYGAGFYDRLLPTHSPPAFTVGVVFDFQLISETPATEGDFALAWVATDARDFPAGSPAPRPAPPPADPPAGPGDPTGPGQGAAPPWSHSRPPPSRAPA
ncbi:MAG TPA: 5-formyltetrahydrofolate cyclo-ligase, partial [Polyangiaceae bacterium]|nr:5-formyltetrahydrofolate cyclo-ligase [Polyangiaceae bacterium]